MRYTATILCVLALVGCNQQNETEQPSTEEAPATETETVSAAEVPKVEVTEVPEEKAPTTMDIDPFTLACEGDYYLKSNDGSVGSGKHSFNLTLALRKSEAFMTDWQAFGPGTNGKVSWNGKMSDMNNDVTKVWAIEGNEVRMNAFTVSLRTGKYKSFTSNGLCSEADLIPIPDSIISME